MTKAEPTPETPVDPSCFRPPPCHGSAQASHDEVSDEELRDYVRRNLLGGVVGLGLLIVALAVVGKYFEPQLLTTTTWVYAHLGFIGLASILLVTDSFITPVPPDVLLIVIAKSDLATQWWVAVPALGVLSSVAGVIGWAVSRQVGNTRIPQLVFGRSQRLNAALVQRYGTIAVALGAITPIPFSITCWTAGIFQMPFRRVGWVTLLRIPRFVGYYLLIDWSVNLF